MHFNTEQIRHLLIGPAQFTRFVVFPSPVVKEVARDDGDDMKWKHADLVLLMWRLNWSVKNAAKESGNGAAVQFALWTGSGLVDALVIVLASCQRFKHHYMPGARTPPIPLCSSARAGIGRSLSVTVAALKASTSYPYFSTRIIILTPLTPVCGGIVCHMSLFVVVARESNQPTPSRAK